MSVSLTAGQMSAAGSPSVKILLKRKAEQSQSSNEAAGKKLRIVDKLRYGRQRH